MFGIGDLSSCSDLTAGDLLRRDTQWCCSNEEYGELCLYWPFTAWWRWKVEIGSILWPENESDTLIHTHALTLLYILQHAVTSTIVDLSLRLSLLFFYAASSLKKILQSTSI